MSKVEASCIIGGVTTALKGIEANTLGSDLGTPTIIETGINYKIKSVDIALANLSWKIERLICSISDNFGDHEYYKNIHEKYKKRIQNIHQEFTKFKESYLELLNKKHKLSDNAELHPVNEVIVNKELHPDVTIMTALCCKKFIHNFSGPILLVEYLKYRSIKILKYGASKKRPEDPDNLTPKQFGSDFYQKAVFRDDIKKINLKNINRTIYTRAGIEDLEDKFQTMFHGQGFTVCVYDEKHSKKMIYMNSLKNAGVKNIISIIDSIDAIETIKEFQNSKLLFIYGMSKDDPDTMKNIASLICSHPDHYTIFIAATLHKRKKMIYKIAKKMAIIQDDTDIEKILETIRKFGLKI